MKPAIPYCRYTQPLAPIQKRHCILDKIDKLETIDRTGKKFSFDIFEEPLTIGKYDGIYYKIQEPNYKGWKHFMFKILFIENTKILIYMISNQDIPELSGKGIVKAMIEKLRTIHKKTILSSTRIESLKVDESEGRVDNVSQYWMRWTKENNKIKYVKDEDRFYYEY
jgi:hypothetical protein